MSTRKIPSRRAVYPHLISILGDSLSNNLTTQVNLADFWPTLLQLLLNEAGASVRVKNCAISGNTTGQMVGRLPAMVQNGVPMLAGIFGGVNDPGATGAGQAARVLTSPAPTPTVFTVTTGKGALFSAGSWINVNDTSQNAGAGARKIQSVVGDVITLTTDLTLAPTGGDGSTTGDIIRPDTYKNIGEMIDYLVAAGCAYVFVVSAQYCNWVSGTGDVTVSGVTTPYAKYVPVRAAQSAIAAAKSVPYVDLYAAMRDLIVAGTVTQGNDAYWHVAVGDQHLNAQGQSIVAAAVFSAIEAQSGWIDALSN